MRERRNLWPLNYLGHWWLSFVSAISRRIVKPAHCVKSAVRCRATCERKSSDPIVLGSYFHAPRSLEILKREWEKQNIHAVWTQAVDWLSPVNCEKNCLWKLGTNTPFISTSKKDAHTCASSASAKKTKLSARSASLPKRESKSKKGEWLAHAPGEPNLPLYHTSWNLSREIFHKFQLFFIP